MNQECHRASSQCNDEIREQAVAMWKKSGTTLFMRTAFEDDIDFEPFLPEENGSESSEDEKTDRRKRERDAIGFGMEDPESL